MKTGCYKDFQTTFSFNILNTVQTLLSNNQFVQSLTIELNIRPRAQHEFQEILGLEQFCQSDWPTLQEHSFINHQGRYFGSLPTFEWNNANHLIDYSWRMM